MNDRKAIGISIIWFIVSIILGFILEYIVQINHEYFGKLPSEYNDLNIYPITGMLMKSMLGFFILTNVCLIFLFLLKNTTFNQKLNRNLISSIRIAIYFVIIAIILGFLIFNKVSEYSYYFNYGVFKIVSLLGVAFGVIGFCYDELISKKST